MNKVLSVIVPSYNMEKYLPSCLRSLCVDKMAELEVIIVNDGSKDGTLDIAKEFAAKYPNTFKVIDKSNGNYGSCINAGLKLVTGKYVKVLDADDSFNQDNLNEYIQFLRDTDVDMVINDYSIVDELGNCNREHSFRVCATANTVPIAECRDVITMPSFQMHAVAYNVRIFENLNYHQSEGLSYTDMEWMFLPMTQVNTVAFFKKTIYKYLVGRAGQTVDENVSIKAVNQTATVVKHLLYTFERVHASLDDLHNVYLRHRMEMKIPSIYRIILLKQADTSLYGFLEDFDKTIKNVAPEIYDNIAGDVIPLLRIPYVRYWRKHKNGGVGLMIFRKVLPIMKFSNRMYKRVKSIVK